MRVCGDLLTANLCSPHRRFAELNIDAIKKQFDVNAAGPLRVVKAVEARLNEGAKVANITSRMGSIAGASGVRVFGRTFASVPPCRGGIQYAHGVAWSETAVVDQRSLVCRGFCFRLADASSGNMYGYRMSKAALNMASKVRQTRCMYSTVMPCHWRCSWQSVTSPGAARRFVLDQCLATDLASRYVVLRMRCNFPAMPRCVAVLHSS